jgi:hypothetical protein
VYWRETRLGYSAGRVISIATQNVADRDHIVGLGLGFPVAEGSSVADIRDKGGRQTVGITGLKDITDDEIRAINRGEMIVDVPSGTLKSEVDPERAAYWQYHQEGFDV